VIHLIRTRATRQQVDEMLQILETYIKLAVDVRQGILAGGGAMHADCEASLLEEGSQQEDVWGADWNPENQEVTSLEIVDPTLRAQVAQIVQILLGGV
jgi:hypothetical protein